MIKELTQEQKDRFPEFVKKWTDIGLCTKRANRAKAEQACRDAYKVAGLEEPKLILWAESPIGLLLTAKVVKQILNDKQVGDSVWTSVRDSVVDSVWTSVLDSVGSSVVDSVVDSVGDSVWTSVGDSVRDSVVDSVWTSVKTSVVDSVGDSVVDSVGDSVWTSVRDSVGDSVWTSVRDSVVDSVWTSVLDSVGSSVVDSVWTSVGTFELTKEWSECYSWGQHDANWLGFYDYFREVLNLTEQTKKLIPLTELAKETGWHLFYKDVALLSEKPTEIHRNERGQLHNFNGPAIKWADGYQLYRFDGVRLDKKEHYAKMNPNEFSKETITKEENADVRRELIRKIGNERLVQILDYKILDQLDEYELISFDLGDGRIRPFLKMTCPSTKHLHIEGVRPEINTVKAALAYKFNQPEWKRPLAEA